MKTAETAPQKYSAHPKLLFEKMHLALESCCQMCYIKHRKGKAIEAALPP